MTLQEKDSQYLWHPYTQHKTSQAPIVISKGEGALLWDENNKEEEGEKERGLST
jgi:adenosylmethionine-8-amino-7-oxononanoate aminotransferase